MKMMFGRLGADCGAAAAGPTPASSEKYRALAQQKCRILPIIQIVREASRVVQTISLIFAVAFGNIPGIVVQKWPLKNPNTLRNNRKRTSLPSQRVADAAA